MYSLAESWDTGQHQLSVGQSVPVTYLDSNEIIAILDKSGLNRKKQIRMLFALITKTTVASRDIEQILGIHRSTALKYAKNLTDLGLITKRIKLGTEDNSKPTYLYSLAPRTTKEAIAEVAKSLGIPDEITSTSNYTQPFKQAEILGERSPYPKVSKRTEAFRQSLEAPLQQNSHSEDSHQTAKPDKPTLESTVKHRIVEPKISSVTSDEQLLRTPEKVYSSVENVTDLPTAADHSTLAELLINKFPEFNSSWSEELQLRWLAAFEQLIKLGAEKSQST